jgi:RNA polymerase sigma factor (sigma-70 family)
VDNESPAEMQFDREQIARLLRFAVMLTGDADLAQDLVQDTMLLAHRHRARVWASDRPDLYVRKILTRQFLSWRRRWSVRHVLLGLSDDVRPPPTPDHAVGVSERDDIWQRLLRLPRQHQVVLALRYYEQLTDAEIAVVLSCAPSTVRSYAARALATLRLEMLNEINLTKENR